MGCGEYYVYTMVKDVAGEMVDAWRECSGHELCPECIDQLSADNARMMEALEWYAAAETWAEKREHYMCHGSPHSYLTSRIKNDKGTVAKAALEGGET